MKVLVIHIASKSWLLLEYADLRPTGDDMKGLYIFVLWLCLFYLLMTSDTQFDHLQP